MSRHERYASRDFPVPEIASRFLPVNQDDVVIVGAEISWDIKQRER